MKVPHWAWGHIELMAEDWTDLDLAICPFWPPDLKPGDGDLELFDGVLAEIDIDLETE